MCQFSGVFSAKRSKIASGVGSGQQVDGMLIKDVDEHSGSRVPRCNVSAHAGMEMKPGSNRKGPDPESAG